LSVLTPEYLGTFLLKELQKKHQFDTALIEDVIMGCVTQAFDQGGNIAKAMATNSGYGEHVAGYSVNRFCASGLETVNQAAAYVKSGFREGAFIAGGIESMSRVKMGSDIGALFVDPAVAIPNRSVPMGIAADLIASKFGYSREMMDGLAVESNRRAAQAEKEGRFTSRIGVKDLNGVTVLNRDENIRESTIESLGALNASFEQMGQMAGFDAVALDQYPEVEFMNHVHTPANSSAIVDGAGIVLIGNEEIGSKLQMKPRARIVSSSIISTEQTINLLGPAPATSKALKAAGMTTSDVDLFEINEAFASVMMNYMDTLKINHDIVNVNGGAMAMGHPLGATGSIILGTLLDELERTDKQVGVASLCIAGGMGIATVIERI
jgi:acetyl-CoA C-acetyltransferase